MKIAILYLRILKNSCPNWVAPLPYEPSTRRFLSTYLKFKPKIPHDLVVVNCGSREHDGMFDGIAQHIFCDSGGFDGGTYQAMGPLMCHDLVLGLNTHTYFWRDGWLERFAEAFTKYGPGIYGATGSYEANRHIRTPSIAFTPEIISRYPKTIDTRDKAGEFEFGPNNFTIWAQSQGYPAIVVATNGDYKLHEIRRIKEGFRRSTQQNCLIRDRHTDVYDHASPQDRQHLESVVYDAAPL
jgi:hypothetical protein